MLVQPVNSFHPKHTQRYKCSQNIASFNVLMMLTALMTVSHLYKNLENIKSDFNVFQVLIKMADSHRNCQHH